MSNVTRFDMLVSDLMDHYIGEVGDGDFVRFSDYLALQGRLDESERENGRLKKELEASSQEEARCRESEENAIRNMDEMAARLQECEGKLNLTRIDLDKWRMAANRQHDVITNVIEAVEGEMKIGVEDDS